MLTKLLIALRLKKKSTPKAIASSPVVRAPAGFEPLPPSLHRGGLVSPRCPGHIPPRPIPPPAVVYIRPPTDEETRAMEAFSMRSRDMADEPAPAPFRSAGGGDFGGGGAGGGWAPPASCPAPSPSYSTSDYSSDSSCSSSSDSGSSSSSD